MFVARARIGYLWHLQARFSKLSLPELFIVCLFVCVPTMRASAMVKGPVQSGHFSGREGCVSVGRIRM